MGYPWLTTVHVAHDVVSMPGSVLKGRCGGVVLILRVFVCFVLLFFLFGSVARCQSTSSHVEVWTLVGATWHWSDLTFIEPSVVKLDYGRCLQSNRAVSILLCSI